MIEKRRPDVLTLSTTFYDLLVSRKLFSKAEIRQFGVAGTEGLRLFFRINFLLPTKIAPQLPAGQEYGLWKYTEYIRT